jgi:lysine-specific permease
MKSMENESCATPKVPPPVTTTLFKKLELRHLNMIALGGSIGTGIFLASGYAVSVGGPGGALLAYGVMALIVYFLMTSLAEMSVYKPSTGTFCDYACMYVGKSFGFAMGYNYWLNWAITIAAEIAAAALVMHYWFPQVNSAIFCAVFFTAILTINLFSVHIFGEAEYFLSFVKVSVILAFIVLGAFAILYEPHFGIPRWHIGDAPFHNGYIGYITVFLFAGFAFQGTELIGVASGEAKNPQDSLPRSIKMVFWRLTLFYVLTIGIITLLISYNDARLSAQDNIQMSPYTLIFSQYLSQHAADFVNFVILVAVLSAANASMYSSSRILWYLGKMGQAPTLFSKITHKGVPLYALLATACVGGVVFISSMVGSGVLFSYLVQASSLSGFIAWFGIALCHLQFRRKYLPTVGGVPTLLYKARWYPFAQITSLCVIGFVILGQCIPIIDSPHYQLSNFLIIYSSLILFLCFYLGHKLWTHRTHV